MLLLNTRSKHLFSSPGEPPYHCNTLEPEPGVAGVGVVEQRTEKEVPYESGGAGRRAEAEVLVKVVGQQVTRLTSRGQQK